MAGFEVIIYGRFWVIAEDISSLYRLCFQCEYLERLQLNKLGLFCVQT